MKKIFLLIFIVSCTAAKQATNNTSTVQSFRFISSHTSFPDTARINGHLYDSVLYSASMHYADSSVLVFVPPYFNAGKKIDMLFWFHGWRNNIDSANTFFELSKQLTASKRNAVLVLAETAKNSPDSYGGKLEQPGMFKLLVNDVLNELKNKSIISDAATEGNICLAGHSGAYRVIAYILQNGKVPVHEVFLFDALYAQVDKFMNWIKEDTKNIFVHWYTNKGGGTDEASDEMKKLLLQQNISFTQLEEENISLQQLQKPRIVFVHSAREHNEIINNPNNFELLLEAFK